MTGNIYSIGVDLGGTNLRLAAHCGDDAFLETITLPTRLLAGRDQVVRDMCKAVNALALRDYGDRVPAFFFAFDPAVISLAPTESHTPMVSATFNPCFVCSADPAATRNSARRK